MISFGLVLGKASALSTGIMILPLLVGCYDGLKGASAALADASVTPAGLGPYLDPVTVFLIRGGAAAAEHTDGKLVDRAVAFVLSVVVDTGAAKGSSVAVANMHGKRPGWSRG